MHEYPNGYQQKILEQNSSGLAELDELFFDTGPTGEQALGWLGDNLTNITLALAHTPELQPTQNEEEVDKHYESLLEISHSLTSIGDSLVVQRIARHYVDQARATTPIGTVDYDKLDIEHLTMSRPDVQRMNPAERQRLLQHEIWTEAERLWAVEQVIYARGYDRVSATNIRSWRILDENLMQTTCDGMTMSGLENWSPTLQMLSQQLSVADHADKRVGLIDMMREQIHLPDDIGSMGLEDLLNLREHQIERMESEMRIFEAQNGPGSPTEKLYRRVRWMETLLDVNYDIQDAGAIVEATLLRQYDHQSANLLAAAIRVVQSTDSERRRYVLTRLIDSTIRRAGQTHDIDMLAAQTARYPFQYEYLEQYVDQLWLLHNTLEQQRMRNALYATANKLVSAH